MKVVLFYSVLGLVAFAAGFVVGFRLPYHNKK